MIEKTIYIVEGISIDMEGIRTINFIHSSEKIAREVYNETINDTMMYLQQSEVKSPYRIANIEHRNSARFLEDFNIKLYVNERTGYDFLVENNIFKLVADSWSANNLYDYDTIRNTEFIIANLKFRKEKISFGDED